MALAAASLVCVLIGSAGCSKKPQSGSAYANPNHIPADQTVTASLQGRIVDENGVPVQGAAVTSGTATATTDINGIFSFTNISMSSRFGFVKVVKQGYFEGSRSIITNPGASNYVNIQLVPRNVSGSFPGGSGGKIVVGPGDTATFGGGTLVEAASGTPYTGTVTVYANYLNPSDPNLHNYMPGDLRGIASNGYETALQSFGMMDVEMQDDAGNKLQLAAGQQAMLTFAIPDSLVATAPGTIPLWYFNDTAGKWIEQGTAVRQGNNYMAQVGHFTFWNCDAYLATVNFTVHVVDQFGNPLAYRYIQFTYDGYARGGYTDSTGFAQGLIPKGASLVMQVLSECGTLIGGVNVGPALQDMNLGTVSVSIENAELTVTGNVVDCSNNPIDSGYVNVLVDGLDYQALVSKGAFSLPIHRCFAGNTPVQLVAGDFGTAEVSITTTITADSGTLNVGTLSACSAPIAGPEYIRFTLKGINYNLIPPAATLEEFNYSSNVNDIEGVNLPTEIDLRLDGVNGTGTFSGGLDSVYLGIGTQEVSYVGPITYTIAAFGPIGTPIQGSFTGTVVGYPQGVYDSEVITGTFYKERVH